MCVCAILSKQVLYSNLYTIALVIPYKHMSSLKTTFLFQVHTDILSSLRAGQRADATTSMVEPSRTNHSSSSAGCSAAAGPGAQNDSAAAAAAAAAPTAAAAAAAAAKDDEGLSIRRATRQRAKARVDAICDVVAITESFVRASLQKFSLPSELFEPIKYDSMVDFARVLCNVLFMSDASAIARSAAEIKIRCCCCCCRRRRHHHCNDLLLLPHYSHF